MARLLIFTTIFVIFAITLAHAQVMQRHTLVCDLLVNDVRISWPPKSLSKDECVSMRQDLKDRDETEARIVCKCTVGDRA